MTIYNIKEKRVGILAQSTFGTAEVDSSDSVIQLDVEPVEYDDDIKKREGLGSHGVRHKTADDVRLDYHGSMPTFPLVGEVQKDMIDHILAMYFQPTTAQISEGATTPYLKQFQYHATQPDFTADAGFFYTVWLRNPDAAKSVKLADVICKSIKMSIQPGETLKYTAQMISRGAPSYTADPSGSWARVAADENEDFFHWAGDSNSNTGITRLTLNDGSSNALTLTGPININLDQDVALFGVGGAAAGDGYAIENRMGTIDFVVQHSHFATLEAAKRANTLCVWNLGWGNATPGTTDGDLDFTFRVKLTSVVPDNSPVLGCKVTAEIVYDASAANGPIIKLANAIDRSW